MLVPINHFCILISKIFQEYSNGRESSKPSNYGTFHTIKRHPQTLLTTQKCLTTSQVPSAHLPRIYSRSNLKGGLSHLHLNWRTCFPLLLASSTPFFLELVPSSLLSILLIFVLKVHRERIWSYQRVIHWELSAPKHSNISKSSPFSQNPLPYPSSFCLLLSFFFKIGFYSDAIWLSPFPST